MDSQPRTEGETPLGSHNRAGDEMLNLDGSTKACWEKVAKHFGAIEPKESRLLKQTTDRLIHENGITFTSHGETQDSVRPWQFDPIPFVLPSEDWDEIETGLVQRAMLLDKILDDLYGQRDLVRLGLLPPELVFAHNEFLRPCSGIKGSQRLILSFADMARGPDGKMWIINDRTQAPSGSGYALENRDICNRLYPDLFSESKVRRLATFFRTLKRTLQSLAPTKPQDPRIVILTPGPFSETYFEHAYLAAYLGFTLVQGDDLTVRDNQVWLRSLGGLEPVHVILRRLDSTYADPLSFRSDSYLGVPGLLNAVREGKVAIANPLGSGVLENPGLMAFLPKICKHFFGEDLQLPSAATWWCGQGKELGYVLENLDKLVIKTISREPDFGTVFGPELDSAEIVNLRNRIKAQPAYYVGQEIVSFSTLPCLGEGTLEHRHGVMRGMVTAKPTKGKHSFMAMPGGLARCAQTEGSKSVATSRGGMAKDTWVLGEESGRFESLWNEPGDSYLRHTDSQNLPSRAGENLFWTGRYAERAEATARVLRRMMRYYFNEVPKGAGNGNQLELILDALQWVTGTNVVENDEKDGEASKLAGDVGPLLKARDQITALCSTLDSFVQSSFAVRDLWAVDSWRVIKLIEAKSETLWQARSKPLVGLRDELDELITHLMAMAGLNLESMTRQAGWLMLDSGKRLERGQLVIAVLGSMLVGTKGEEHATLKLENLLAATGSLVTHQRRYRAQPRVETVLELMLQDENNPRSLAYQLQRIHSHEMLFPGKTPYAPLRNDEKLLLQASTTLKLCDVHKLAGVDEETGRRERLDKLLDELAVLLAQVSEHLTQEYFSLVTTNDRIG